MAKGAAGNIGCIIFGLIWLAVLVFLALPIAFFLCWFYVVLQPLAVCIDFVRDINQSVYKGLTLPTLVTEKMLNGESC